MRMTRAFFTTLRAAPADAEIASHVLLARTGLIHRISAGLYAYTPAMWRTVRKIADIVREEMDRAGAQELMLPIVQPRELWDESGRLVAQSRQLALVPRGRAGPPSREA